MKGSKKNIKAKGKHLLWDPHLNKGTAFTLEEREDFSLTGLLPSHVSSIEEQVQRRYRNFCEKKTDLEKYVFLSDLQGRNATLFYRLVLEHITEMLPYIYTPTVGAVSLDYSIQYQQSKGLFLTFDMKDEIETILERTKREEVEVIVITDGGRTLGLGDVGIGGMVIPIGKLALYSLFGGIAPAKTLPIFLDVGTDNEELLRNPLYLGRKTRRVVGDEYNAFVDTVVKAIKKVYPKALLQWEDFAREHALPLLERYKDKILSFNDDIQGTAASTLAGLISAVKKKRSKFEREKILIYGAGSAGLGIANIVKSYLQYLGLSEEEALDRIYMIDLLGLLHDEQTHLSPEQLLFAKKQHTLTSFRKKHGKIGLHETIKQGKITILIGVSAHKGAFDKKAVRLLLKNSSQPIIFPLSNPNEKSEAEPKSLCYWSKGKALVATGSPFPSFVYKGIKKTVPQCNNVYIFPAFGLAAASGFLTKITEKMFLAAAEELSNHAGSHLFPPFTELRDITKFIAARILKTAEEENLLNEKAPSAMDNYLHSLMWYPDYHTYEPHTIIEEKPVYRS
jgi:malate dehydrogenase (oxaloacetate-decarboxylating)